MWCRLLGHQIQRPTSRFSAVTSTERTMKVSSSTPKATAKPISVMNTSGSVPRAANVASTIPAEVITSPVAARPISEPRRVPWRLLVDPGHEEDVVVGAEGDQEHKGPQRERRVGPGEPEDVLEDQGAHPQRGRERQHHGGHQQQRRDNRAQHQGEDDQHHQQDQRHDQVAIVAGGPLDVEVDGAAAADLGLGATDCVHA